LCRLFAQPERSGDRVHQQRRVRDLIQLDEPDPILEFGQ
jgi:hypothetical protein